MSASGDNKQIGKTIGGGSGSGSGDHHRRIAAQMDAVGQFDRGGGGAGAATATATSAAAGHGRVAASAIHRGGEKKVTPPPSPLPPGCIVTGGGGGGSSNRGGGEGGATDTVVEENVSPPATVEGVEEAQDGVSPGGGGHDDDDHSIHDHDHDHDDLLHDIDVEADELWQQIQQQRRGGRKDEEVDRMLGVDSHEKANGGDAAGVANENGGGASTKMEKFDIETGPDSIVDEASDGTKSSRRGCCGGYNIGATTVLCPTLYAKTNGRYGVIGPHWPGLLFTFSLLYGASYYYVNRAFSIGPLSGLVCLSMTALTSLSLILVAFADPGVITPDNQRSGPHGGHGGQYAGLPSDGRDLSDWRYCDLCAVYQPPTAAHCPDCNVCVEGYDHHCPWMGTCIGKRNIRAFVCFNLSWMSYLIYALGWVTIVHAGSGRGGVPHDLPASHNLTRY